MAWRRFALVVLAAQALSTGASQAIMHDLKVPALTDSVSVIHAPTGCMARLEAVKTVVSAAFITDPLCLPAGVRQQPVPVKRRDFRLPYAQRQSFIFR